MYSYIKINRKGFLIFIQKNKTKPIINKTFYFDFISIFKRKKFFNIFPKNFYQKNLVYVSDSLIKHLEISNSSIVIKYFIYSKSYFVYLNTKIQYSLINVNNQSFSLIADLIGGKFSDFLKIKYLGYEDKIKDKILFIDNDFIQGYKLKRNLVILYLSGIFLKTNTPKALILNNISKENLLSIIEFIKQYNILCPIFITQENIKTILFGQYIICNNYFKVL